MKPKLLACSFTFRVDGFRTLVHVDLCENEGDVIETVRAGRRRERRVFTADYCVPLNEESARRALDVALWKWGHGQ